MIWSPRVSHQGPGSRNRNEPMFKASFKSPKWGLDDLVFVTVAPGRQTKLFGRPTKITYHLKLLVRTDTHTTPIYVTE